MHKEPHPLAGQTITTDLKAVHPQLGDSLMHEAVVEDWWDRVSGDSWMDSQTPVAYLYGMRIPFAFSGEIPLDNEVVYVKIGAFGHLIHESEILS